MKKVWIFALLAVAMLSGCQSVQYGDATATETVNTDFGSTDLQMIAAKMVDDVLAFPPVVQITAQRRPVAFVDRIKNKTTEHIDLESVTDTIESSFDQLRQVPLCRYERGRACAPAAGIPA